MPAARAERHLKNVLITNVLHDLMGRKLEQVVRFTATTQHVYDLWREIGYGFYEPDFPRHALDTLKGVEVCASTVDCPPRHEWFEPLPHGRRQRREVALRWHNGVTLAYASMLSVLYERGHADQVEETLTLWHPFRVGYLLEFDPTTDWNVDRQYQVADWPLPDLPAEPGITQDVTKRLIQLLEEERLQFPLGGRFHQAANAGFEPEEEFDVS